MKLGLGTVQFGCNYGISNTNGQVSIQEAGEILDYAKSQGINTLDTASLYGSSEEVLGKFDLSEFNVITKTIKIDKTLSRSDNLQNFADAFYRSQKKLGYIKLYGLMFHEANDLLGQNAYDLWDLVNDFKEKEYVEKIGVSVYTPEQLSQIINVFDIDIVQLPLNILDQRFLPMLSELKSKNIEVHTRSSFLQGLLLMNPNALDEYFDDIKHLLNELPEPRFDHALNFLKNIDEVDKIIVGTTCKRDLVQIVESINNYSDKTDYSKFAINDEKFILPQNWQLKSGVK